MTKDEYCPVLEALDQVVDEASFLSFLDALSEDWFASEKIEKQTPSNPYGPRALDWENWSIGQFLEGASGFAGDTKDNPNFARTNIWRRVADIIYAGKIYE